MYDEASPKLYSVRPHQLFRRDPADSNVESIEQNRGSVGCQSLTTMLTLLSPSPASCKVVRQELIRSIHARKDSNHCCKEERREPRGWSSKHNLQKLTMHRRKCNPRIFPPKSARVGARKKQDTYGSERNFESFSGNPQNFIASVARASPKWISEPDEMLYRTTPTNGLRRHSLRTPPAFPGSRKGTNYSARDCSIDTVTYCSEWRRSDLTLCAYDAVPRDQAKAKLCVRCKMLAGSTHLPCPPVVRHLVKGFTSALRRLSLP